jgi:hypothetical protein
MRKETAAVTAAPSKEPDKRDFSWRSHQVRRRDIHKSHRAGHRFCAWRRVHQPDGQFVGENTKKVRKTGLPMTYLAQPRLIVACRSCGSAGGEDREPQGRGNFAKTPSPWMSPQSAHQVPASADQ